MSDVNSHPRVPHPTSHIRHTFRGFTLVELLVVISIIALLLAILLPGLSQARESGRRIQCLSIERQIGIISQMYASDHTGRMPGYLNDWANPSTGAATTAWWEAISNGGYTPGVRPSRPDDWNKLFSCSSQTNPVDAVAAFKAFDFGLNAMTFPYPANWGTTAFKNGRPLNAIPSPADRIMLVDNNPDPKATRYYVYPWSALTYIHPVHGEGVNALYVDGHGGFNSMSNLPTSGDWTYTEGFNGFAIVWGHNNEFK